MALQSSGHDNLHVISQQYGGTYDTVGTPAERNTISLDNSRRTYDLKDQVIRLEPRMAPFFTMLAKIAKKPTPDPIFKMMEQRHQWQRRNFVAMDLPDDAAIIALSQGWEDPPLSAVEGKVIATQCNYDIFGKMTSYGSFEADPDNYTQPEFFVENQIIALENVKVVNNGDDHTGTLYSRVQALYIDRTNNITYLVLTHLFILTAAGKVDISSEDGTWLIDDIDVTEGHQGQVIGTAFPEGSRYPGSWKDELAMAEGYAQIFKTACPMFSGTSMATELRGVKNEFARTWKEKLKEHKMDIEHSVMFNVGHVRQTTGQPNQTNLGKERFTWGIIPYLQCYGYNISFDYNASGYNDFVDFTQDFFAPESGVTGSKVVIASRDIIGWFSKNGIGSSFLGNTVDAGWGAAPFAQMNLQMVQSQKFGFNFALIKTPFGDLKFIEHPLLRNQWKNHAFIVDLNYVNWRPLKGNGISRDTFITTNVQDPGYDGRIDQILTEAGLEITMPEAHALIKFVGDPRDYQGGGL